VEVNMPDWTAKTLAEHGFKLNDWTYNGTWELERGDYGRCKRPVTLRLDEEGGMEVEHEVTVYYDTSRATDTVTTYLPLEVLAEFLRRAGYEVKKL
jgi:hypothetical protein